MRLGITAVVVAVSGALLVGCGGDSGSGSSSGSGGTKSASLDPASAKTAKGTVTLCLPKDVSGAFHKTIAAFNKQGTGVTAKLLELPESADEQRNQLVQRSRAKSPECDVEGIDVIWTAEFANQGWLKDMTKVVQARQGELIPSTVETTHYDGKYWAMPYNSNAALLYYRSDQVPKAPTSWQDVYKEGARTNGFVYQGAAYEGLTVDFLELLYSAGGKVLSDDGKSAAIDSQQTRDVLSFMRQGIKDGAVPKAVVTYMEEPSRMNFEAGRSSLMRNWPYAYALGNAKGSKIAGKFKITNLPGWNGGQGAGVLGGTNLAISTYSKNPSGALAVIDYFTSKVGQRYIGEGATPPTLKSAYQDPSVRKAIGLPDAVEQAISQAKPRPVSPVYTQISEAIYKHVNPVLTGDQSVDSAVSGMQKDINAALKTF